MNREQLNEWKEDIKIAKELCYPKLVIEKISAEIDPEKRTRILYDARNGHYDSTK